MTFNGFFKAFIEALFWGIFATKVQLLNELKFFS